MAMGKGTNPDILFAVRTYRRRVVPCSEAKERKGCCYQEQDLWRQQVELKRKEGYSEEHDRVAHHIKRESRAGAMPEFLDAGNAPQQGLW